MIRKVDFQKASPSEVADFINTIWKNTDPHVKDLDLKLAPGAFTGKTVTLRANDLTLSELVGRIAEQLKAVVIIRPDSILLAPDNNKGPAAIPVKPAA